MFEKPPNDPITSHEAGVESRADLTIASPEKISAEFEALLPRERLKTIFDRATGKYEDQYGSAIIGVNFELSEEEINDIGRLIDVTRDNVERLKQQEPLWPKFLELLGEFRSKFGSFGERGSIISDPGRTNIEKAKPSGRPSIIVPEHIRNLYVWDMDLQNLVGSMARYVKGQSRGTTAVYIGRAIKNLYRFNYELASSTVSDADRTAEATG